MHSQTRQTPVLRRVVIPVLRVIATLLFALLGPIRTRGRYRVPQKGGLIVMSNHIADIDPIVVQYACPRPIYFMGKHDLFPVRFLGAFLRYYRVFPVKRGEPDRGAIRHAVELLKEGEVVGIFPEGELSETGEQLPLKPGVALIARMAGVPILCVGLRNTNRVLPYGRLVPRPALCFLHAEWGEPRCFGPDTPLDDVISWCEAQLRSLTGKEM